MEVDRSPLQCSRVWHSYNTNYFDIDFFFFEGVNWYIQIPLHVSICITPIYHPLTQVCTVRKNPFHHILFPYFNSFNFTLTLHSLPHQKVNLFVTSIHEECP
eukprot:c56177_g1_i1 orf=92-397(+)